MDVAATVEVAALIGKNNAKDLFISSSRQPVEWLSSSRLDVLGAKIRDTDQPYADWCSHGWEDGDWKVGKSATKCQ